MWLTKIFLSSSGKYSDTAHRKAVRPVVVVERVHTAGVEVQVSSVRIARKRRTTPVVAILSDIRDSPRRVVEVPRGESKVLR
jgi:hypothetical protein